MANCIYFISGLGADQRIFKRLTFSPEFELICLNWIIPDKDELLENYAFRLAKAIDHSKPFYLIGVSFGGFIAVEIAKHFKPEYTFIISSVPTRRELPWYYKIAGSLKLLNFIPVSLLKSANTIAYRLFGVRKSDHKLMLKHILLDTDPLFLKWALKSSLNWQNNDVPINLTHIHGTDDQILPIRFTHPDYIIINGGHLMVYVNADEVSEIIRDVIK